MSSPETSRTCVILPHASGETPPAEGTRDS